MIMANRKRNDLAEMSFEHVACPSCGETFVVKIFLGDHYVQRRSIGVPSHMCVEEMLHTHEVDTQHTLFEATG